MEIHLRLSKSGPLLPMDFDAMIFIVMHLISINGHRYAFSMNFYWDEFILGNKAAVETLISIWNIHIYEFDLVHRYENDVGRFV